MFEVLAAWEAPFLLWIQDVLRQSWLDPAVSFYTHLGDGGFIWIALSILMFLIPKGRRAGLAMALALVCSLLLTNGLLKNLVQRPRPWLLFDTLVPLVTETDPNSFPSGHTSAAFAAMTALLWAWPDLFSGAGSHWAVPVCLALAISMGLSRLYVGVHYPTDVFFGALVGCLCGFLGWRLEHLIQIKMRRHL